MQSATSVIRPLHECWHMMGIQRSIVRQVPRASIACKVDEGGRGTKTTSTHSLHLQKQWTRQRRVTQTRLGDAAGAGQARLTYHEVALVGEGVDEAGRGTQHDGH